MNSAYIYIYIVYNIYGESVKVINFVNSIYPNSIYIYIVYHSILYIVYTVYTHYNGIVHHIHSDKIQ